MTDEHGEVRRFVVLFSDITAMKRTEEQLYHMAHYDSLTGLANRRHFQDLLERGLKRARRSGELLAVMFIDLDTFKLVNDNLGHRAGDQLLVEAATRINGCVRESDTVARMGGDEFTVILSDLNGADNVVPIAQRILKRIGRAGHDRRTGSVRDGEHRHRRGRRRDGGPGTILRSADGAMYRVKERGRNNFEFFSRQMNNAADERLVLQSRVRRALDTGEFLVHYQPQVHLGTGGRRVEALVRWRTADKGLREPASFIPVAERTGQIGEIGRRVLRLVCGQAVIWRAQGVKLPHIAVNISAHQLLKSDFLPLVESVLVESGLPPGFLEFELTESALVEDNPETFVKLERLKSFGVSLAIDDFGTKYSSLAYLKRLPVDRLEDRPVVRKRTSWTIPAAWRSRPP